MCLQPARRRGVLLLRLRREGRGRLRQEEDGEEFRGVRVTRLLDWVVRLRDWEVPFRTSLLDHLWGVVGLGEGIMVARNHPF